MEFLSTNKRIDILQRTTESKGTLQDETIYEKLVLMLHNTRACDKLNSDRVDIVFAANDGPNHLSRGKDTL